MHTRHSWARLSVTVVALALMLGSSAWEARSESTSGEWVNDLSQGHHRFVTHGAVVWGHKFGFLRESGYCDLDHLRISWSSTRSVDDLRGTRATLQLDTGTMSVEIPMDLVATAPLTPQLRLIAFANFIAGTKLIEALSGGGVLVVKVIGPDELVSRLDILSDTFSLNGFAASRDSATTACRGELQNPDPTIRRGK